MAAKLNKEPMELAKNYDPKKSLFPAIAQVKYDGVPLTFRRNATGHVQALSRQNEIMVSVPHLVAAASHYLTAPGASFTGECLVPGLSFKVSSGLVRSHQPCSDVVCIVFDAALGNPNDTYSNRINEFRKQYMLDGNRFHNKIFAAPTVGIAQGMDDIEKLWETCRMMAKDPEGMMLHHVAKTFQPGKRCWGMTRYKPQPTIDLEIESFEEAVSEAGEPLGMLGRINVHLTRRYPQGMLRRSVVGIGPGKSSHDYRRQLWKMREDMKGQIAEIKYMPDPTYDALRQPTFQRIRTDKTKADVLEYPE